MFITSPQKALFHLFLNQTGHFIEFDIRINNQVINESVNQVLLWDVIRT